VINIKLKLKPNVDNCKEWTYKEMLIWIVTIENGLFLQYYAKLKDSFEKNDIKGSDIMDITDEDLSSFGINFSGHRKILSKYLKRLANPNITIEDDTEGDKETETMK